MIMDSATLFIGNPSVADFKFFAIPPTIIPILNMDSITNNYPRMNCHRLSCRLNLKNRVAVRNNVMSVSDTSLGFKKCWFLY